MLRLLLAAILCPALIGCSSYTPPRIEIASESITDRTNDGVAMRFDLLATNANEVELPLREVTYSLELGGQRVFTGTRSPEATLRRRGVQGFTLPAVIPTGVDGAAGTGMQPYRLSGTLTYVTPGQIAELLFDSGVRVPTVGFSLEGEIDMSRAAPQ